MVRLEVKILTSSWGGRRTVPYAFTEQGIYMLTTVLRGEPFKADMAYQRIYSKAERSVIVSDDYIGSKTFHHLAHIKPGVRIVVIGDNKAKPSFTKAELEDLTTKTLTSTSPWSVLYAITEQGGCRPATV